MAVAATPFTILTSMGGAYDRDGSIASGTFRSLSAGSASTRPESIARGPSILHLISEILRRNCPQPGRAAADASYGACYFIVVDFGQTYPAFLSCFSRSRIAKTIPGVTISLIVRSKLSKRQYSKLIRIMVAKLARQTSWMFRVSTRTEKVNSFVYMIMTAELETRDDQETFVAWHSTRQFPV